MKPKKLKDYEIENIISNAVDEAVDFVESEISPERVKAQRYFDGQVDIGYEQGRSKVVSTKVRDIIRAIKPSLMRIFLSTDKAVEYVPKGPEDFANAEQATSYMHWKFQEMGGYRSSMMHFTMHSSRNKVLSKSIGKTTKKVKHLPTKT